MSTILSILPRACFPDLRGGLEITAHEMLDVLAEHGWNPSGAGRSSYDRVSFILSRIRRKLFGPYATRRRVDGFQVWLDPYHAKDIRALVQSLEPAALICHVVGDDAFLDQVCALDLPTLFYVHESRLPSNLHKASRLHACRFAAGSTYVCDRVSQVVGGHVALLRPLLSPATYATVHPGSEVLVVNPHPVKGGGFVLEMARRLKHRLFRIVGGWEHTRSDAAVRAIESALSVLPNVTRVGWASDLGECFARSRVLLMPCLVDEAFGRVAAESLMAGVPVLASNRGALPETVGEGGETLGLELPLDHWLAALERFFLDESYYHRMRLQALRQASEASRQPAYTRGMLVRIIEELIVGKDVPTHSSGPLLEAQ